MTRDPFLDPLEADPPGGCLGAVFALSLVVTAAVVLLLTARFGVAGTLALAEAITFGLALAGVGVWLLDLYVRRWWRARKLEQQIEAFREARAALERYASRDPAGSNLRIIVSPDLLRQVRAAYPDSNPLGVTLAGVPIIVSRHVPAGQMIVTRYPEFYDHEKGA